MTVKYISNLVQSNQAQKNISDMIIKYKLKVFVSVDLYSHFYFLILLFTTLPQLLVSLMKRTNYQRTLVNMAYNKGESIISNSLYLFYKGT